MTHARLASLALSLLFAFAADGCARVVKRGATQGHTSAAGAAAAPQFDASVPKGAHCLEPARPEADPDDYACPSQSDPQGVPSGLCFGDAEPCPGVDDHVALLTFDDGPSDWTHSFLDILADEDVHATFFVNAHGRPPQRSLDDSYTDPDGKVVIYRDVLARTLAEGHVVGNHTRDHLDLSMLDADGIHQQLQENELLVSRALIRAGRKAVTPMTLMRPPFGLPWFDSDAPLDDPAAKRALAAREIARYGINVLWNLSSTDAQEWAQGEAASWRELANAKPDSTQVSYDDKVDRIRSSVLDHPLVKKGRGIVVLMHDTHNATRDALRSIIDGLRDRGYVFRTVDEQLIHSYGHPSADLTPGPNFDARCAEQLAPSCAPDTEPRLCGRLWRAFEAFGGADRLGAPLSAASEGAPRSQRFEHGTIELHPELDEPCHAILQP